jgi:hypothetical protein
MGEEEGGRSGLLDRHGGKEVVEFRSRGQTAAASNAWVNTTAVTQHEAAVHALYRRKKRSRQAK